MTMQAGKLNQRLILYRTVTGQSPMGAPTSELVQSAAPWAELIKGQSATAVANDREQTTNSYQFRLRWRENVEPGDWLKWRGKWLKINAVNDSDPLRTELVLDAEFNPKSSPPDLK